MANLSTQLLSIISSPTTISIIKTIVVILFIVMPLIAYSTYAERRISAIIQDRLGPNRVGMPLSLIGFKKDLSLFGLFQPMADGVKGFLKEEFTPNHVNKFYFILAPVIVLVPPLVCFAVIPFSSSLFGNNLVIADIGMGPIFIFAITSLSVYGIVLAGWSSNSKYPFLGGIRSTAQMISYEIALGLSLIPILMIFGELNLSNIVKYQQENGWLLIPFSGKGWFTIKYWLIFIPVVISFLIMTTSIFAETNRMPFDLPECETELVGGYHTEYGSMKFAIFFLGEYAAMVLGSALIVTLFLGGWSLPFGILSEVDRSIIWKDILVALTHLACFLIKLIGFIIFFIWVRWTVPRLRYDQLMKLGWLIFFEAALLNIIIMGIILLIIRTVT